MRSGQAQQRHRGTRVAPAWLLFSAAVRCSAVVLLQTWLLQVAAQAAPETPPAAAVAGGGSRGIRREQDLAPKREYELDSQISKTKDLKPTQEQQQQRPTLSAAGLGAQQPEVMLDEKLDEEISLAQSLLAFESTCDGSAPVQFRLADLYWEKSKRAFFKMNDFATSEAQKQLYHNEMRQLQNLSLANYQSILDECPTYSDYAKTLYFLGRALTELDRGRDGATYFKKIIKDYPDSEWISYAWFMIGEFYFNIIGDANQAFKSYGRAMEKKGTPVYAFSLYKRAWCRINTADWQAAMDIFHEVVRVCDDPTHPGLDAKGRASLRKEALKDYVRAYANAGDAKRAYTIFLEVGGAKAVQSMLSSLGHWYINQGKHRETVATFRELIRRFPRSGRLATYQGRVVEATSALGARKEAVQEARLLAETFRDTRRRMETDDFDAEDRATLIKDVAEAEELAENILRRMALDAHKEGKKLFAAAKEKSFQNAQELYRAYLSIFPEPRPKADVNYVFFMRFYFAEVLYQLGNFAEAADNYDRVVSMNPRPIDSNEKKMVVAAAEEAVRSYDELVTELDKKDPPTLGGTVPKPIPAVKQKLIEACRRYIDYVGSEGDKIVQIRYKMARIYYTYNHFAQAAPAFDDIVENHPGHEVACYAANLALDIYNGNQDYVALKAKSHAYGRNTALACGEEERKKFALIEEQASFLVIKTTLEDKKEYVAAGNAYLEFYRDFPRGEFADDAVYNAAVNYDLGNRLDKANEVRRFLVEKLPQSPLVPETLYNIAQSYERVVDFQNAAHYLEMFAQKYPNDARSKDAIFNAGLYRATLRDFAGAKQSRLRFIELYPGDKDAPGVSFAMCESTMLEAELMEKGAVSAAAKRDAAGLLAKKWQETYDCFADFARRPQHGREAPDLLCEALFRRTMIARHKLKTVKGASEAEKNLRQAWPQWKQMHGLAAMPRCAAAMAQLQFIDVQERQKDYLQLQIAELNPTERGKKRFDATMKAKADERDQLIMGYKAVVDFGVVEWGLASLYNIGEVYRDSIDKLLQAPIPDKIPGYTLTSEDKNLLRQQLREMARPIEELAIEAYRVCVDKANELAVYNEWSIRALKRLQELVPSLYAPVYERTVPTEFVEPLKVVANSLIYDEAGEWKSVRTPLTDKLSTPPGAAPGNSAGTATTPEADATAP